MSTSVRRPIVLSAAVYALLVLLAARADGAAYNATSDHFPTPYIAWFTKSSRIEWVDLPPKWWIIGMSGNIVPSPLIESPQLQPGGEWTIDSFFDITFDIDFAGEPPLVATGTGHVIGTGSGTTSRFFETEMLSLDLVSGSPILFRESSTLPSTGQATIDSLPGGGFRIDSFFDVFMEISLDDGATWSPSQGSTRLESTPEPSSLILIATGALAFGFLLRRRCAT